MAKGMRWDQLLAAAVAILATVGFFWILATLMKPRLPPVASASRTDVLWIPRPRASAPVPRASPVVPIQRASTDANVSHQTVIPAPTERDDFAEVGRTTAVVYLMQIRASARDAPANAPAPFSDRVPRLPGEGRERFRMRSSRGVPEAAMSLGRLFGAHDEDPCREHRRNIGNLALDGDSAALQQQIEYERVRCRP